MKYKTILVKPKLSRDSEYYVSGFNKIKEINKIQKMLINEKNIYTEKLSIMQ